MSDDALALPDGLRPVALSSVLPENPTGLHLTGDLRRCMAPKALLCDASALDQLMTRAVLRNGLTIVGRAFHTFEPNGVTGCLLLAESHVSIHTWPELQYVNLDVYVCNHEQDNSDRARALFRYIAHQLRCVNAHPVEWQRGVVE